MLGKQRRLTSGFEQSSRHEFQCNVTQASQLKFGFFVVCKALFLIYVYIFSAYVY